MISTSSRETSFRRNSFSSEQFEQSLNNWVIAGPTREHRCAAAARIRNVAYNSGTFLNLSDMRLTTLPPYINELRGIRELNLARNDFTCLPDLRWGEQLNYIDLSGNFINNVDNLCQTMPSGQPNLSLSLQGNEISSLPNINNTLGFARLDLRDNFISTITPEVARFGACDIDLRNNPIVIDNEVQAVFDTIQAQIVGYSSTPTLTIVVNEDIITIGPQPFNQGDD